MPILKQLVASSSQSKRRSRVDLTADMISAPLGDFRHTMHVGRGGDVFGDTSFLSTRFGDAAAEPQPKPSLLSRRFRSSSKRSQSVTRVDKRDTLSVSDDTDAFVKNAVSLPQLNDQPAESSGQLPKSLSSSPVRKLAGDKPEEKPLNGATSLADRSADYPEERDFGDLTDLPPSRSSVGFPLKHAESIMSFHVDLGPSMLNDILSVMEKDAWENDSDLGFGDERPDDYADSHKKAPGKQYAEGSSVSPLVLQHSVKSATYSPGSGSHLSQGTGSVSSLASGTTEERQSVYEGVSHGDGDSIKYTDSVKAEEEEEEEEEDEGGKDFAFMDEEDEIRV